MCAVEVLLKAIQALAAVFSNVDQGPIEKHYADAQRLAAQIAG